MEKVFKLHPQQKDFCPLFGSGDVPGLLAQADMEVTIPAIVDRLPNEGIFVEVGCFLGKSTVSWAENFKAQDKKYRLLSIDSFNTPPQVIINLLLEADFVIPDNCIDQIDYFRWYTRQYDFVYPIIGMFDTNFSFPGKIMGVFEDSTHTVPYLTHALPFWWDKLVSGGILSGHDYNREVRTAVDIFAAINGLQVENFLAEQSSIWYIQKN